MTAKIEGFFPPGCSDPAVSELGFKDLEWKSKRLHQLPAVIAHRSVNLNAEAIAKFRMLLQILLNGRVGDMGAERLVVGVDLRPHKCLGIVRVLIKGVVNHAWLRCLNGFVGDASQFQVLVNTTGFDVDSRQQHERCGIVEAGHWISGGAQVFHGFR